VDILYNLKLKNNCFFFPPMSFLSHLFKPVIAGVGQSLFGPK
jgi:hypothetical protein